MTVPPIPQLVTELKITQDDQPTKWSLKSWWNDSWRGILSELLSTMMLVLFGCMSCLPIEGINTTIYAPFGFGFMVMLNIQIFGHISGAYMNPAITIAAMIWGSVPITVGIIYIIVECIGAVLGYGILMALSPLDLVAGSVCVSIPYAGLGDLQSLGVELALTVALTFINCGIWDPINASKQDSAPIKFGLTIVGLSLVGGPLTGASMNPARTLAPAVWTGLWAHQWVYWIGPCVGSTLAVIFYKKIFLRKREGE
uniref:Aquaporin n=1 Tax=Heliothis virescens TaxID=7102 RepID=A0A2A4ITK6_HELVI